MIDQKINNSLRELEQSLKNIDSARKQVEKTISSYDGLQKSTSEYVAQLGSLTTKMKEVIKTIGEDYNQKIANLEKELLKTEDIHPPKTGISVHFSGSLV